MGRLFATIERSGPWIVFLAMTVSVGFAPLLWLDRADDERPQIRIVATGDNLSALVVDGGSRILVINSDDREETIEALGRLARPWEADPDALIAPANDRAATGLWEALQRTNPKEVVIVGLAGSDPLWHAIEQECNGRGVNLRYVAGTLALRTSHLELSMFAPTPDHDQPSAVVVRHADANVAIALSDEAPDVQAQILVGSADTGKTFARVVVVVAVAARGSTSPQMLVSQVKVVRLSFDGERVVMFGGKFLTPPPDAPTAASE